MKEKFPFPCCRCGFCCLSEQCPISKYLYGKQNCCPALFFEEEKAYCKHPDIVPFGDGCCMAARCFKDGVCYDFAALSEEKKVVLAQNLKTEKERI